MAARKPDFSMMLTSPTAYEAEVTGFARALRAGIPAREAARLCGLQHHEVAGVLKSLRRRAGRAARGVGRRVGRAARTVAKYSPGALALKYTGKLAARATAGARRRIFRAFFGKLIDRRARLLSWQQRRSLQPTAAERQQAQLWSSAYVKRKGLLGKLVGSALSGDLGAEPTTALLAVSVPVLLEFARRALKVASREGAPADPRTAPSRAASHPAGNEEDAE